MAPVNAGYSKAVNELKKSILEILGKCETSAYNILEFTEWITSLWRAVKHETFIFSFRNSLVADAYMKLCTEWEFKKEMYSWTKKAETKISHFGRGKTEESDFGQLLTHLENEAYSELSKWEGKLLDNLEKYFKQTKGHVDLVEAYRADFAKSVKSLHRSMKRSIKNQLTVAKDIRRGMSKIDRIKENHTRELEEIVHALIEECRSKKVEMTNEKADKEFDKMWNEMVGELDLYKQEATDVLASIICDLRDNLMRKGGHVCELLDKKRLQDCGEMSFKYAAEGR
ncbi:LOW QUALITY PROTEIN: up-regulator of cell proliferation-like [Xyrichtys novacula]|uniref:LOW QUALITY PROTEIN: up-regulator of cell proliferation-like n=1 Tax=Xyrichtys novacula TaxID=13765 RepID=A0AAV1HKV5_XYRNO|nr:LOW QUALITY PROTEIN: up-regulator of cell proliferation-like [Xyrichtys novacula]